MRSPVLRRDGVLFVLLALLAAMVACLPPGHAASARPKATRTSLHFDQTCSPGRRAVIAAVGDLLFHDALQVQAYKPLANFRQFWAPVAGVLAGADVTYGNLESPIAEGVKPGGVPTKDPGRTLDRVVYGRMSDALIFNTHPSVATDLKAAGFSVISTANNHAADRGALGIDRTLDALTSAGLAATGTRRKADTAAPTLWHTRTTANGITIAWLACTFDLNGMPDRHNQVLQCYRDKAVMLDEIHALAIDPAIDAVIVTPHWGEEDSPAPMPREKALARELVDAGATAILGAHPHVLQPWEKLIARDGREALIVYSLGNFISNQPGAAQRTGIIALLELTKPDGEAARLSAAGFVPTFVDMTRGHLVTELTPGAKAYDQAMRLLPAGNRVSARAMRDLPRDCRPAPPAVVASADGLSSLPPASGAGTSPLAAKTGEWGVALPPRLPLFHFASVTTDVTRASSGRRDDPACDCTCLQPCLRARLAAVGDRRGFGVDRGLCIVRRRRDIAVS